MSWSCAVLPVAARGSVSFFAWGSWHTRIAADVVSSRGPLWLPLVLASGILSTVIVLALWFAVSASVSGIVSIAGLVGGGRGS